MSSMLEWSGLRKRAAEIRARELGPFRSYFDQLVNHINCSQTNLHTLFEPSDEIRLTPLRMWNETLLNYNVPWGKLNRGLTVVINYDLLAGKGELLDINNNPNLNGREMATLLGWCMEMLQAAFLITDDIMDNSITRRGQPCWYRKRETYMNPKTRKVNLSIELIQTKVISCEELITIIGRRRHQNWAAMGYTAVVLIANCNIRIIAYRDIDSK